MQIFEDYRRGGLVPEEGPLFCKLDSVFWQLGVSENYDTKHLADIRELRESNLMTKADIRKYCMIRNIGYMKYTYEQFWYLIDWDPSLLVPGQIGNRKLLPGPLKLSITMLCEFSLKYYPNELGFLFDPVYFVGEFGLGDEKPVSLYEFGCDKCGNGYMQGILNTFMCAQMKKDPSKAIAIGTTTHRLSLFWQTVYPGYVLYTSVPTFFLSLVFHPTRNWGILPWRSIEVD